MSAPRRRRGAAVTLATAAALALLAGCGTASANGPTTGGGAISSPSSQPPAQTTIVGTVTHTATVDSPATTTIVSEAPNTVVVTPTDPTLVPPPPTTSEPAPVNADCPYLTNKQVMYSNGQHTGQTTIIETKPYPVCVFVRSTGGFLAAVRIVVASTPAAAAAAVNEHVPIDTSYPVSQPAGWSGGAMATPHGVPGFPDAESIYAVSKGTIAIIALSNQKQSIKGRQMVQDIVTNLGL